MKIRKIFFVSLVLLLLSGCSGKEPLPDTSTSSNFTNSPEAVMETVLKDLFTSDYKERYSKLSESDNPEVTSSYYESLTDYVTDSCIETLISNRIPYKYDKMASDGNYKTQIKDIKLTYDESQKLYDFEVLLDITGEGDAPFNSISGQIGLEDTDTGLLIDYLYIRI